MDKAPGCRAASFHRSRVQRPAARRRLAAGMTWLLAIALVCATGPVRAAHRADTAGEEALGAYETAQVGPSLCQGATFHRLGPVRAFDSRTGIGGATALRSSLPSSFQIGGSFGVPADATAVTGTFTIAAPTYRGYVALTPVSNTPATISTSTVNFTTTDARATGLTIPLGPNGEMWALYNTGRSGDTVHFILDISGYFSVDPADMQPLPGYFRGWMPSDAWPTDSNGVVLADYGGASGLKYNPVTISEAALAYYDRWQSESAPEEQKTADRTAFFAQINWLAGNQTSDGLWLYDFRWGTQAIPWWSAMAEGLAISALLRAYSVTADSSYLPIITRAETTFRRDQSHRGVTSRVTVAGRTYTMYQEYMPGYYQNVLNGWMFALIGPLEAAVYLEDPMAAFDTFAADRGLLALRALVPLYDTGTWSYYSLTTFSGPNRGPLAKRTYHKIHIAQLAFLGATMRDSLFVAYSQRFERYLSTCTAQGTCPTSAVYPANAEP